MHNLTEHNITDVVVDTFANAKEARVKTIMTSLVRHLHAFIKDVNLTEAEWMAGIQFLTATGQKCDDKRQEFILLSDVLGLSMLTIAMNNDKPVGCTEATVFGPFYFDGAPEYEHGDDVANGAEGEPCDVYATVRGLGGEPVSGAVVDVWQADAGGHYDVQHAGLDHAENRGTLRTGPDGSLHFRSVVAVAYPIPVDGPVGDLLRATKRHPWRPAHLHFKIEAPGYERLITHVFRDGDEWLDSDAVFAVRQSLVAPWKKQDNGRWRLDFDFVLNPMKQPARQ